MTAALVALCAAALIIPGRDSSIRRLGPLRARRASDVRTGLTPVGRPFIAVCCLAGLSLLLVWTGTRYVLLGGAGLICTELARRIARATRQRAARRRRQADICTLCDVVAAELRAGLPAPLALERACSQIPEFACIATAVRLGGDVPAELEVCAARPGAEGLRAVAAAWVVTASAGAGLATVLERIGASLRSDEEARAEVQAALGPPRATAKMLAVLPLFGVGLGASMGTRPLSFLLATPWGLGCLSFGVLLALLGVWWVERLAAAAER